MENENLFLIYISSKESYALQLFHIRPFDFLVKPIKQENIFQVLDQIYRIVGKSNFIFEFQNQKNCYRIFYKDILYFQREGRKIIIIMKDDKKPFYGKLTEVEKKIPENLFLRIHKSFLVNRIYVKEFTYESIKMINGEVLNISKSNRTEVRRKILESTIDEDGNL